MNPFTTPDAIYISKRPQDMRAGIQRLASIVAADLGRDPMDGALYCFVSRDCEKMKLLRFDVIGWCMYYVRLSEGGFKWRHPESGELLPDIGRRQLLWLLEGLPAELPRRPRRSPPARCSSQKAWLDLGIYGIICPWESNRTYRPPSRSPA